MPHGLGKLHKFWKEKNSPSKLTPFRRRPRAGAAHRWPHRPGGRGRDVHAPGLRLTGQGAHTDGQQPHPALGEHIDGREPFRQHHRVVIGQQQDRRPEQDPPGGGRDEAQGFERIGAPPDAARRAASRAVWPVPQPMSSTCSSGPIAAASRNEPCSGSPAASSPTSTCWSAAGRRGRLASWPAGPTTHGRRAPIPRWPPKQSAVPPLAASNDPGIQVARLSMRIGAEADRGDPAAGATVRPIQSPAARPVAITGPVMPPWAAGSSPAGRSPEGPISHTW